MRADWWAYAYGGTARPPAQIHIRAGGRAGICDGGTARPNSYEGGRAGEHMLQGDRQLYQSMCRRQVRKKSQKIEETKKKDSVQETKKKQLKKSFPMDGFRLGLPAQQKKCMPGDPILP